MGLIPRLIRIWIAFIIPTIGIQLIVEYYSLQKKESIRSINGYVGSKFSLNDFLDLNGNSIDLDFDKSDLTIVDFWHKNCPPCIMEMKNYKRLIEGHEKEISIVSISINNYGIWKELFSGKSSAFQFLIDSSANWRHLVLKSKLYPKLKNILPSDNIETIANTFQTNEFPAYLVVNRNGLIVATPASAVDFIRVKLYGRSEFFSFLINPITWVHIQAWLPQLLLMYSGFFWIVLMVVLLVKRIRNK